MMFSDEPHEPNRFQRWLGNVVGDKIPSALEKLGASRSKAETWVYYTTSFVNVALLFLGFQGALILFAFLGGGGASLGGAAFAVAGAIGLGMYAGYNVYQGLEQARSMVSANNLPASTSEETVAPSAAPAVAASLAPGFAASSASKHEVTPSGVRAVTEMSPK